MAVRRLFNCSPQSWNVRLCRALCTHKRTHPARPRTVVCHPPGHAVAVRGPSGGIRAVWPWKPLWSVTT